MHFQVVIPTSSVKKISKEKTAKIIPNAVGVATAEERHVFGSFISREAAYRLMCSVCPPLETTEILPKDSAQLEVCEEFSIEDESSCSISGNESSAQATENSSAIDAANAQQICDSSQVILRRPLTNTNLCSDASDPAALKYRNSGTYITSHITLISYKHVLFKYLQIFHIIIQKHHRKEFLHLLMSCHILPI